MLDGALGRRLAEEVAGRTGFAVLGYWDNGLRHISSVQTAFRRPADCAGRTLRTLASDDLQRVFRALGFEPVAIDVRDLPGAVASGRVDAQENPLTNIYNFDLHKTHRTITLTGHLLGVAPVFFNRRALENLPQSGQEALMKAVSEATAAQRSFALQDDTACAEALRADGVELIGLAPEERRAFEEAAREEVGRTRGRFSRELLGLFAADLAEAGA